MNIEGKISPLLPMAWILALPWVLIGAFLGATVGSGLAAAQIPERHTPKYVSLEVGQVSVIEIAGLQRVAIGNPEVVSYKSVDDDSILLIGTGSGHTDVHVWTEGGRQVRYWVSVGQRQLDKDIEMARRILRGVDRVQLYKVDEKIVVEGEVSERDHAKIAALKELFPHVVLAINERTVVPKSTVRIDAVLVEISNGDLKNIGVDWDDAISGPALGFHKTFQSDNRFVVVEKDPDDVNTGIVGSIPLGDRSFFSYFGITSFALSRINLLHETGRATILTSPKLTTLDGQEASFQVGGQFPIPFIDNNGALTVERQEYGVLLNVTPYVDEDLVRLKIGVELSDIDTSVQVNGIPGLKKRNTQTTVQLKDNQTIAISGLFQVDENESSSKVPLLGDIPYVKKLFSSNNNNVKNRQVVVLITPKLISAGDADDRAMSSFAREHMGNYRSSLTLDDSLME